MGNIGNPGTFYEPVKNTTDAYFSDGTDQWFGRAPAGVREDGSSWMIWKIEFSGANWITKYPVDTDSGKASDQPKFKWGTNGSNISSYTFRVLGT